MGTRELLLIAAALLPAVVLGVYVFKKDRVEKEPLGLLIKLLAFGVLTCIPVLLVGEYVHAAVDSIFSIQERTGEDGSLYMTTGMYYLYNIAKWFVAVALVEEGFKMFFLVIGTRKDKNFNHLFDGIIYAVFVSLGFAGFENILYVLQYGFANALMRAVLAVPGHTFYGVMMGCYYSFWHITDKAKSIEDSLKNRGLVGAGVAGFDSKRFKILTLLVPTLAHGLYDFCCSVGQSWAVLMLYAFVIYMYIYCFGKIKSFSKADVSSDTYATALVIKKYPHLKDFILNSRVPGHPENIQPEMPEA